MEHSCFCCIHAWDAFTCGSSQCFIRTPCMHEACSGVRMVKALVGPSIHLDPVLRLPIGLTCSTHRILFFFSPVCKCGYGPY